MRFIITWLNFRLFWRKRYIWAYAEYDRFCVGVKKFLCNVAKESGETKDAALILQKYVKEGNVSVEEQKQFRNQLFDVFKAMGIGIPFILIPGASLLLPIVVSLSKKY